MYSTLQQDTKYLWTVSHLYMIDVFSLCPFKLLIKKKGMTYGFGVLEEDGDIFLSSQIRYVTLRYFRLR